MSEPFRHSLDWLVSLNLPPKDFLEYHQATMSPYRGMRGEIVDIEQPSVEKFAGFVLLRLTRH